MADVDIRRIGPDELVEFLSVLGTAYGHRVDADYVAAWRDAFDYDRNVAVCHGGRIVGTATSGLIEVTTPGPVVVPAVVTGNLTVDRRTPVPGLAEMVFREQCRRHRAEGYPFVVFSVNGVGLARSHLRWGSAPATTSMLLAGEIPAGTRCPPRDPAVAEVPLLADELDQVHRRVAAGTPGMISRAREWMLAYRRLSARQHPIVVYGYREAGDGPLLGYAVWYRAPAGAAGEPSLVVDELAAADDRAGPALLAAVLGAGAGRFEIRHRRVDDPLTWWLRERAVLTRREVRDALWLHLLDVPGALTARRYLGTGRVHFEVAGGLLPDVGGCFTLDASPDGATCRRSAGPAPVRLPVGSLAAMYFGQVSARTLAGAGQVAVDCAATLDRFDAVFRTAGPPWSGAER